MEMWVLGAIGVLLVVLVILGVLGHRDRDGNDVEVDDEPETEEYLWWMIR